MIRSLRPNDLIALAFSGKDFIDAAKTRCRLTKMKTWPLSNAIFLQQWLTLENPRHTWVWLSQGHIRGVLSARHRASPRVWEIDRLLLVDDNGVEEGCIQLLDRLSATGGERGVDRVFLRLASGSPLLSAVRQAGFNPYETETLYQFEGGVGEPREEATSADIIVRRRLIADDYSLFHLRNAVLPPGARTAEGLTFAEWRDGRDTSWGGRGSKEFIFEKEGSVVGWLRVGSDGKLGHMEFMIKPSIENCSRQLVWLGLGHLKGTNPVLCLVPQSQFAMRRTLTGLGFAEIAEYINLVKHLAVRVKQSVLVPMQA